MSKTILITGATGKIGKIIVKHFLEEGDEVIALSKTKQKLKKLKDSLINYGDKLKLVCIDLMSKNFEIDLIKQLDYLKVNPDCLINNARSLKNLSIDQDEYISEESMMNEFKLGVVVPYKIVMTLVKQKEIKLKKIVNISSIYGVLAPNLNLYECPLKESPIHYGLAKSSLIQLTKELAVRLAEKNILVNCVAYGGVEGRVDSEFKLRYANLCPSGRMLKENEIAKPIELLLSEGCEGINGHVLMVDGGWTIW